LDDVLCNEAYDELLTQEFNPEIEDFEECGGSDVEGDTDCRPVQQGFFIIIFDAWFVFLYVCSYASTYYSLLD
jgi:hypothetical protein